MFVVAMACSCHAAPLNFLFLRISMPLRGTCVSIYCVGEESDSCGSYVTSPQMVKQCCRELLTLVLVDQ